MKGMLFFSIGFLIVFGVFQCSQTKLEPDVENELPVKQDIEQQNKQ